MNDDKLITLVREYPVLYDSSHEKYNDRNYKSTIWSKIAEEMETTGKKYIIIYIIIYVHNIMFIYILYYKKYINYINYVIIIINTEYK
jgi:hypothetical protein